MTGPRISYVDPATITDADMLAELDRCRREGTPRPESQAVRAHVPAVFWAFANSWRDVFKNGVADHAIKELCRLYVSRSVKCEYCGNQRSMKAAKLGAVEDGLPRPAQLREVHPLQRPAEGGAGLGRGHHLGPADRRCAVGAAAPAFHRAGAGRDRLLHRADHGPAALAPHPRHRAPPGAGRHRRLHGAGLRDGGGAAPRQGRCGVLGARRRKTAGGRQIRGGSGSLSPSPSAIRTGIAQHSAGRRGEGRGEGQPRAPLHQRPP